MKTIIDIGQFIYNYSLQQRLCIMKSYFRFTQTATMKHYAPPLDFSHITIPEKPKLKIMEKVPQYIPGIRPPKYTKRLNDMRGPELVHCQLLHKQYGIMSITGGKLRHGHFEMIRNTINRRIDTKRMFAVWRLDPPWKPITKKGQGQRMGGGKGPIDHYVTPIKAGRIIIELGGKIELGHVQDILTEVVQKLPFQAMVVSEKILEDKAKKDKWVEENNINPYTFEYIVKNNMQGCSTWISPYDYIWFGKYR